MAYTFIVEQRIASLPVDPFKLVAKNGWSIKTVTQIFEEHGLSISTIKDGITMYSNGHVDTYDYHIIYNEKVRSDGRIRWTIMHEIGHIVLRHFEDFPGVRFSRGGITGEEYDVLEKEAEIFAACVLAPPIVLYELKVESASQIQNICKISRLASENRFNYQSKWNQRPYIDIFSAKVSLSFRNFVHRKQCLNCGHGFVSMEAVFCPICGNKVRRGEGTMIYEGYDLDENGRPDICPVCENEELGKEDNHCKICGTSLVNKCTGSGYDGDSGELWECETIASGNARYCIKCGEKTTYFKNSLLASWGDERDRRQE
ncbi:MAG: ImmA/IrrE family metallo-endopeptidase [Eubacteriales bacterium]